MAPWRIELFGGLRAVNGNHVVTRFPTWKTGALLGYLAYDADRRHPREVLIDLLWQDDEKDKGQRSLRMALTFLRRHLPFVLSNRSAVWLDPAAVTTDVAEFLAAL
jgi:DNA-binding SARP family transcriptional activator